MDQLNLSETAQHWLNLVLIWIGFGTVVGLIVRSLVPGREPHGPVSTLLIGMAGSCIGPLVITFFWSIENFNPISPVGFASSLASAFLCLILYKIGVIFMDRNYHQRLDR